MDVPDRRPNRLRGYDYSQENFYFVTLCVRDKQPLFGRVGNGLDRSGIEPVLPAGNGLDRSGIELNALGRIAEEELRNIPNHFAGVCAEKYAIMPDHIHAILTIGCDGKTERSRPFPTLSVVIGLYKSGVSRRIHALEPGSQIWQKSFHDRVIRNEAEHREILRYIEENPMKRDWEEQAKTGGSPKE